MRATQSIAKRYFIPEYSSGGLKAFEIFLCGLNLSFRFGASFRDGGTTVSMLGFASLGLVALRRKLS
jgi:hypothetical protein